MTEALENVIRYERGELARRLIGSEDGQKHLGSTLEQLAYDLGMTGDPKGFVEGVMASKQGIETTVGNYVGKRQDAMSSVTVQELSGYYGETLDSYLDGTEAGKIKAELGKFSDETFGDITKKLKKAKYDLDGEEHGELSDEKKNSAEAVLKKYENVMLILQTLENDKMEKLRPSVVEKSHKKELKEIAGKL